MRIQNRKLISQMSFDWYVANHFGAFDAMQPKVWKLDIVEYALARVAAQALLVENALDSDQE
jgi:hypothetical protein